MYFRPRGGLSAQEYRLRLKQPAPNSLAKPRESPLFKSSTRLVPRGSCAFRPSSAALSLRFAFGSKNMPQQFFSFESELQNTTTESSSSHCSSVQERLVTYGSEALDSSEHLGVILGSQKDANALLQHFGSLAILAQASVEQLLPFISRSKAIRLVSSLRMGAVTLRENVNRTRSPAGGPSASIGALW